MEPPKKASKWVLGTGGAVGLGTVILLIGYRVDPVQAQLNRLEDRTTVGIHRVEGKLDALILLQLGGNKEVVLKLLDKIDNPSRKPGGE